MHKMDLVTPYQEFFKLVPANTDELREEVYRIRYNVYCAELGWEDASRFPNGLETDDYDDLSRHCLLLHRGTNSYAGCVRLVKANPNTSHPSIPLQEHCSDTLDPKILDIDSLPRGSFGEISRLAIKMQFRRRLGQDKRPDGMGE